MKKSILIAGTLLLLFCLGAVASAETIKIGATPVPHAEILNFVVPLLADEGITLEVIEFTDYVQPNLALQDGELDANFFQHIPYLDDFNANRGTNLVSLVGVHIEPLGVYSAKIGSLDELPQRAQIAIPNDVTNGGRALLLLQQAGLIELDPKAGIEPTVFDIIENKLGIRFSELEAAQLTRVLPDVHAAVINGNYALQAGFSQLEDAIFLEDAESPYVNVIAVREGETENPALQKLVEVLLSDAVRDFILEKYEGLVIPVF
jgi:D-methionine transport system substrate-binding protein